MSPEDYRDAMLAQAQAVSEVAHATFYSITFLAVIFFGYAIFRIARGR